MSVRYERGNRRAAFGPCDGGYYVIRSESPTGFRTIPKELTTWEQDQVETEEMAAAIAAKWCGIEVVVEIGAERVVHSLKETS